MDKRAAWFLPTAAETGAEGQIVRRLRAIAALDERIDLAEMLQDPSRMRRSSKDPLTGEQRKD